MATREERIAARRAERIAARRAERIADREALAELARLERVEARRDARQAGRREARIAARREARKQLRALQTLTKPVSMPTDDTVCFTRDGLMYRGALGRWFAVGMLDSITWHADVATAADLPAIDSESDANQLVYVVADDVVLSSHNGATWVAPDVTALQDTDLEARNTVIEDRVDAQDK